MSSVGIRFRVMSFTSAWFGPSAYSLTPLVSVSQGDCTGKLPVGITNPDNPYGSPGLRPLPRCTGGVQGIESWYKAAGWVVSKLKQGKIDLLQAVDSKHFDLRVSSGLKAANPIDVGVRARVSTGPGRK